MDINKEYFQTKSMELENLLKEYKNQYPKNIGALVRNFFPIFLIILSVLAPLMILYTVVQQSMGLWIAAIFVAPVMFVFGMILIFKNKREQKADPTILPRIDGVRQQIEPYTQYPDVKNYLDQYNAQITETDNAKRQFKKKFRIGLAVFFLVFILVFIALPFIVVAIETSGSTHGTNESNYGLLNVIGVEKDQPFLSLTPMQKEIYPGCKIASDTVHFYYYDNVGVHLTIHEIEFENADHKDVFRLTVTDKNGVPVAGCGKFVFTTIIDVALGLKSEMFCVDRENESDTRLGGYNPNNFKAFETARYLRAHKDDLTFIIEKIN